jgi:hypothetical protein
MPAAIAMKRAISGENAPAAAPGCGQSVTEMFSTGYPWWMPSRTKTPLTLPLLIWKTVLAFPGPATR